LPTDKAFQLLNPYQKILLAHAIFEKEEEKYIIIDNAFKLLSGGLGLGGMVGAGIARESSSEASSEASIAGPGEKINMEFDRHRKSARETGKIDLSPAVRAAFDKHYSKKREKPKVLRLSNQQTIDDDDPSILGD
jgi:hypothetical protein